jgi:hypothetical protein
MFIRPSPPSQRAQARSCGKALVFPPKGKQGRGRASACLALLCAGLVFYIEISQKKGWGVLKWWYGSVGAWL